MGNIKFRVNKEILDGVFHGNGYIDYFLQNRKLENNYSKSEMFLKKSNNIRKKGITGKEKFISEKRAVLCCGNVQVFKCNVKSTHACVRDHLDTCLDLL